MYFVQFNFFMYSKNSLARIHFPSFVIAFHSLVEGGAACSICMNVSSCGLPLGPSLCVLRPNFHVIKSSA